ncbi:MAG: UDP-N-acetylglucosamine 2-epimerase (non-hydrolyzing) [Marivivens sp.]|nr:UDP-N-acetylglucosamine 2-epimerase (non-hydrolyzing) [Marivivens sp.]
MVEILTVIGARPQFIKAAAVSRMIAAQSGLCERLLHTGQHFDTNMSDVFFEEMGIPAPTHHLGVAGGSHGEMTGRMLEGIEQVLLETRPDVVMVYGDTNSTVAGALAASKLHIPVAHVEAGLRSFNRRMPEELNRILTDHCSDLLFTPTSTATNNLRAEGVPFERILQVGDVMYDAARHFGALVAERDFSKLTGFDAGVPFVLATVHRQENTDDPERLAVIIEGLAAVTDTLPVALPLHPRTRGRLQNAGLGAALERLTLLEPLGYLDMVVLEKNAALIATDSGGVQKEAFFHGVPCVTLRDETEWVELVDAGWNRLVPPLSVNAVSSAVHEALGSKGKAVAPYGDGNASAQIIASLVEVASR